MTTQDKKQQRPCSPPHPISNYLKNQFSAQELSGSLYKAQDQKQYYQIQSQLNYSQIQFLLSYQHNNHGYNYQSDLKSISMQGLELQNNKLSQQTPLIPQNQQQLCSTVSLHKNIKKFDTLIHYNQNQRKSSFLINSNSSVQESRVINKNKSSAKETSEAGHTTKKVLDAIQKQNREQSFKIKDTESYSYYTDKINKKESSQIYFVSSGDSKLSHNKNSIQKMSSMIEKNQFESTSNLKKGEAGPKLKKIKFKNNSTHTIQKARSPNIRMLSQIFPNTQGSSSQFVWNNNKSQFIHQKNKQQISEFSLDDQVTSFQGRQNARGLQSQQIQKKCQNQLDTTFVQYSPRPTDFNENGQKNTRHNSNSLQITDNIYQNNESRNFDCINKQTSSPSPHFHQQRPITQNMDRYFKCVKTVDLALNIKPLTNLISGGKKSSLVNDYNSINPNSHRNLNGFSPFTNNYFYSQNASLQGKSLNQSLNCTINVKNIRESIEKISQHENNSNKKTKILQISKILSKGLQNYSTSASKQNKRIVKLNNVSKITKIKPFNPEDISNQLNMPQKEENKSFHSKGQNNQHKNLMSPKDCKSGRKAKKLSVTLTNSHLLKYKDSPFSDRCVKNSKQIYLDGGYKDLNLEALNKQKLLSRQLPALPINMNGLIRKVDQYKNSKETEYQQYSQGCLTQRNKNNMRTQIKTDNKGYQYCRRNIRSVDLITKQNKQKLVSYIAPIEQVISNAKTAKNSKARATNSLNSKYQNPKVYPMNNTVRTSFVDNKFNSIIGVTHNSNFVDNYPIHTEHIDVSYRQIQKPVRTANPVNITYMNNFLIVNGYQPATQPHQQTHSIFFTSPAY